MSSSAHTSTKADRRRNHADKTNTTTTWKSCRDLPPPSRSDREFQLQLGLEAENPAARATIVPPIFGPFYNPRFGGRGEVIVSLIVLRVYTKHEFRTKFLEMIVQSHLILGNKRALSSLNPGRKHTKKMSETLKTSEEEDRNGRTAAAATISYLPDIIIEKILSFLPIDRAAQANTVSKQWSTLWPSFPVIDLDEERFSEPQRFRSFLRHSLRRCRNQKNLDKLRVRGHLKYSDSLVWRWLDFAIDLCVKELDIIEFTRGFQIDDTILTSESLTSLNLENVKIISHDGRFTNYPVSLPLLKSMSLNQVYLVNFHYFHGKYDVDYSLCALVSGCPCMEHLSIRKCKFGDVLEISSNSLKCLDIRECISEMVEVKAKNLKSFTLYSDFDPCHKTVSLLECDNLKHVDIDCVELEKLILHSCLKAMQSSFNTPYLEYFEFSGYPKAKVHFVEAPPNLLRASIRIWGDSWPVEYYSAMRDFLESFDCSEEVDLHFKDAQCLIIPEDCRMKWSPPLPSMKQLLVYFYALPIDTECLAPSLVWMAPSAEITPFLRNGYNNEYEDDSDDWEGDDHVDEDGADDDEDDD